MINTDQEFKSLVLRIARNSHSGNDDVMEAVGYLWDSDNWHRLKETSYDKFLREVQFAKKRDGTMEELVFTKSTTSLTTTEHNEFCSQIRIWASQLGCWLAEPNEETKESNPIS